MTPEAERILRSTEAAANAWMNGDVEPYLSMTSRGEDYTIMGPFGGAPIVGFSAYEAIAPGVASVFRDGTSQLELIESHVSGDLMVLILIERQEGVVGGGAAQDWSLRVTQVYRREEGDWKVVHRHADPLIRRRTLEEAKALAG